MTQCHARKETLQSKTFLFCERVEITLFVNAQVRLSQQILRFMYSAGISMHLRRTCVQSRLLSYTQANNTVNCAGND